MPPPNEEKLQKSKDCLDDETIADYVAHQLSQENRVAVENHLAYCHYCLHEVAQLYSTVRRWHTGKLSKVPRKILQRLKEPVSSTEKPSFLSFLSIKAQWIQARVGAVVRKVGRITMKSLATLVRPEAKREFVIQTSGMREEPAKGLATSVRPATLQTSGMVRKGSADTDILNIGADSIFRFGEVSDYLETNLLPFVLRAKVTKKTPYKLNDLQPPDLLYFHSSERTWEILNSKLAVSIVGSSSYKSDPTGVGRMLGRRLAVSTVEYGRKRGIEASIVSGCAFIIDEAAHEGAADAKGATVAVIPRSVAKGVYPHPDLFKKRGYERCCQERKCKRFEDRLLKYGCLVSENDNRGRTKLNQILARDRITTALSDIVVVVECKKDSGTVDTGLRAILQGVPLVVIDWEKITDFCGGDLFTGGNRELLSRKIPNRPVPKGFPERKVELLLDQDQLDEHWHPFLDTMLNNPDRMSCRLNRWINHEG